MVNHGLKTQDEAIDFCNKRNAGLPLPKSKWEVDEFLKITGKFYISNWTWIGLTDSTQSGNKTAWKDLNGNPIGGRYVNLRVTTLIFCCLVVISDPVSSGLRVAHTINHSGMDQLHTIDKTELCGNLENMTHFRLGVYKN